ncbi:MAG: dihydroneopterin aldolase [Candidatus Latescibacteria bacterium]|nr:dihydroneopterin aldolase [Candidatus Latescibacterota bacterium]
MTDRLLLRSLTFHGHHGVTPGEREEGQDFEVDVEVGYDQRPASDSDDLEMAVNARDVYRLVKTAVEGQPCNLLETVAQLVADALLELPRVESVVVRLKKPGTSFTGGVGEGYEVEITRP